MLTDPTGGVGYPFGAKLPSADQTTIATQQVRALDAVDGGTFVTGADVILNGAGIYQFSHAAIQAGGDLNIDDTATVLYEGTTNLPTIGSRSYPIDQSITTQPALNDLDRFTWPIANGVWVQSSVASAGNVTFGLPNLPNQCTVTDIVARVHGAIFATHGGDPSTLPALRIFKVTNGNAVALGSAVTDPSANLAAYEIPHDITFTGLSEVIDGSASYFAEITGEFAGSAVANAFAILRLTALCTCTEIAPG